MNRNLSKYLLMMLITFSMVSISTTTSQQLINPIQNKFTNEIDIELQVIASGFNSPAVLTNAGDGTNRLFVADQTGIVYVVENDVLLSEPFLDISDKIVDLSPAYDERGLLGITFHQEYENNGKFYVYYSSPKSGSGIDHESILSEYTVSSGNANLADPNSEKIILRFDQPEDNHNGGQLEFGPDGYLYIGSGDGGGAGDDHGLIGNGQDITNLLGKILRIDVDSGDPYSIPDDNPFVGTDGSDEIYAYGFRNPWKFCFDPETFDLFVADVGQDKWEEIDIVIKGGNYGWRIFEGNNFYDEELLTDLNLSVDDLEFPIHEYDHDQGKSITGGYVYRGDSQSELFGAYIFGDWSNDYVPPGDGKLYYLKETEPGVWDRFDLNVDGSNNIKRFILSFGEDELGNIYVLSKTRLGPNGETGDVRRIFLDNDIPTAPIINGQTRGNIGVEYTYSVVSSDPDGDDDFYYIDWGDGSFQDWSGPFKSGQEQTFKHTFEEQDNYVIKAKARNEGNVESLWGNLLITMPRTAHSHNTGILYFVFEMLRFFINFR